MASNVNTSGKWLTYPERVYEYHKLVRMIVRAYHTPEDIIVTDALCHLIELHDTPTNHTVTDKQVAQLLALPDKRVQSVLTALKQRQLIKLYAPAEELKQSEPLLEHISKRQKFAAPRGQQKAGLIWYIDYPHLLKVLQWRRYSVYQQLNQHVDQSAVYYTCPTPGCKNYGRHLALMELLLEDAMKGGEGGGFACDGCDVEVNGKKQGTPLVVVGGAATGTADSGGSDGQESIKALFNVQIQPISAQMKLVEQLLDEQAAHAEDVMAEAHAPRQLAADDATTDITVDIAAAPGASGAAAAAGGQQPAAVVSGGSRVLHVPTVRADQAKGVVAALPWAEGGIKGLEEERKREEETRRKEREDEEERQRQTEQARYQQQYDEELQRMKALHGSEQPPAAPAVDESMVVSDDAGVDAEGADGEVLVSVGGRQVPLSAITQADLDEMTSEESAMYDMYAGTGF